ncbi:MAG: hypothetical protein ACTS5I_02945 [Rhodanobacter sp.]
MLPEIVLILTACASNAVEQQPAAASSGDGNAVAITGIDSQGVRTGTSVRALVDCTNPPETPQVEQDAEDLYGTPPVRDPWARSTRPRTSAFLGVMPLLGPRTTASDGAGPQGCNR